MTKKMLVACSDTGQILKKTSFVLPIFIDNGYEFISIPNNSTIYGVIVYTGVEINHEVLFDKLLKSKTGSSFDKNFHEVLFKEYLGLIAGKKVGDIIKFNISEQGAISFEKIN